MMLKLMRSVALVAVLAILSSGCLYLERVSTTSSGGEIPVSSHGEDVSADGRYVLFRTEHSLVALDTNAVEDLYRKDTLTGAVDLVSRSVGAVGDGPTADGDMSDDGRWIVFTSSATNLVPGDTNGVADVFVHDMVANVNTRASVDSTGSQSSSAADYAAISGDGLHVSFSTVAPLVPADVDVTRDVYRFNRSTGAVVIVSSSTAGVVGDGASYRSSIDFDGSLVVFDSFAENLIPSDTNGEMDVFGKFAGGLLARVSTGVGNTQATGASSWPSVSGNGLVVSFHSSAFDLTAGDLNGMDDVFVKAITGDIWMASVATDGTQGSRESQFARMNNDGTLVSFHSRATELTTRPSGHQAVVVRDGVSNVTTVATRNSSGTATNGLGHISPGGTYVMWTLSDPGVVPGDTNGTSDVFLIWWSEPEITSISPSTISLGATQPVTISGTGFNRLADTDVYAHANGIYGITFSNIVVVDSTTITADVESVVGITPLGPRVLFVEAAGEGPGQTSGALAKCTTCLTVAL